MFGLLTHMLYGLQANLEVVLGFELAQEDYDAISNIDFQLRLVDGIRFLRPEGPFRCPFCVPFWALSLAKPLPLSVACGCIALSLYHMQFSCNAMQPRPELCKPSLMALRSAHNFTVCSGFLSVACAKIGMMGATCC